MAFFIIGLFSLLSLAISERIKIDLETSNLGTEVALGTLVQTQFC